MIPRTKIQIRVFALSQSLPDITTEQKTWAFANCLDHLAYRAKKNTHCLDCGHIWPSDHKITGTIDCPGCGVKLIIEDTRKKITAQKVYAAMLDVSCEFQIVRFFEIRSYHKAGVKAELSIREVVQQFINNDDKAKDMVVARNMGYMGSYTDNFSGDLEIRDPEHLRGKFNLYANFTFPNPVFMDIYRRNGFDGDFKRCSPYYLLNGILDDCKTETLLKAGQYSLLRKRGGGDYYKTDEYWNSIKIAMRNGYIVEDAGMWIDYLDMLKRFNKDLRSPKYVCPADLKAEHNRYMELKRIAMAEEAEQRRIRDAIARQRKLQRQLDGIDGDNKIYQETHGKYFGLSFSRKNITIRVLESVYEFKAEGEALAHCVYTSEYYRKEKSLILAASVDGKPMETIEVKLDRLTIEQARGWDNAPSEYHEAIIAIVKKNMPAIKKRRDEVKQSIAA